MLLAAFILFFFNKKNNFYYNEKENQITNPITINTINPFQKKANEASKSSQSRIPANARAIKDYLPFKAPPQLQKRWEHKIVDEDDQYITSQLFLDGRSLAEYFYKWQKIEGSQPTLVAGELPEISKLESSFPSKNAQNLKLKDLMSNQATLLSSKEVWIIDSTGTLLPFLKIEIQRSEKPKKTNGHEYWMYDISKDLITKTIQADRY